MTRARNMVEFLVKNKEEFKLKVLERLITGNEFVKRKMEQKEDSERCWKEFIIWDNYNLEMIKQAFEYPDNTYAQDYDRIKLSAGGFLFSGDYKEPTVEESINSTRDEMNAQVWKLERFSEKIELLRMKEGVMSQAEAAKFNMQSLLNLIRRFHKIAQELRLRRKGREPIVIRDEYDVQYLLGALLKLHFDDIRSEEYSPSNSGANTRLDFVLKDQQIIIETKMTNENLKLKSLGEELLVDIGRYKAYPNFKHLIFFIYDKGDYIINKSGLINDLEKQSTAELNILVEIIPK